jgi:uncharacterized protein (TIGR00290 family)
MRANADVSFSCAITMMNEDGTRSRSHGLRPEVVQAQADALGLLWIHRPCSWPSYESAFVDALRDAAKRGVTHLVCGDILYPEHKQWVERMCAAAGLTAVEPLWGHTTLDLYREFLARGGSARIVALDSSKLTREWLFRQIDEDALKEFARLGVDPCGENGEYHTVVTACPAFSASIALVQGDQVLRSGYWAVDVRLADFTTSA